MSLSEHDGSLIPFHPQGRGTYKGRVTTAAGPISYRIDPGPDYHKSKKYRSRAYTAVVTGHGLHQQTHHPRRHAAMLWVRELMAQIEAAPQPKAVRS